MPSRAQDLAERLAQRRGLARRARARALSTSDDLAAEPANGLRHLDADRPAAEHEQAARDGLHAGRLAVGPDAIELAQPRHGRDDRLRAGRDDDVLGRVAHAVDLDHARSRPAGRVPRSRSMPCSASQRSCPASE